MTIDTAATLSEQLGIDDLLDHGDRVSTALLDFLNQKHAELDAQEREEGEP